MKIKKPEDADVIVQKLPCDMGIHRNPRKGTLNAPSEMLEGVKTEENILVSETFPDEFSLEKTQDRIEENTEELLDYEKPLISLGGDHSVSFPVIRTLKDRCPDMKLVWLDSHLDVKKKVKDHVSHDVVVRELLKSGFEDDEIFFVGSTRIDEDERKFLEDRDIRIYRPSELEEFKRVFESVEQPIYLSIDIDVLDESLAPGTGYPDGEMTVEEVREIIDTVEPDHADIVEVAPCLDEEKTTLKNSREILSKIMDNF